MRSYYQLTGAPGIPPRFGLGLLATYWGFDTIQQVVGNVSAFRQGNYPLDLISELATAKYIQIFVFPFSDVISLNARSQRL